MVRMNDPAPDRFGQTPVTRGYIFECLRCGRPFAVSRDAALRAWGERGVVAEAARRLRCSQCGGRGMRAMLAPARAGLGSKGPLERLLDALAALRPRGPVE